MAETTFYPEFVAYAAVYQGAVNSVNQKTGNVTLYASDIPISSGNNVTVAYKLNALETNIATNADIDALF